MRNTSYVQCHAGTLALGCVPLSLNMPCADASGNFRLLSRMQTVMIIPQQAPSRAHSAPNVRLSELSATLASCGYPDWAADALPPLQLLMLDRVLFRTTCWVLGTRPRRFVFARVMPRSVLLPDCTAGNQASTVSCG